MGEVDAVTTRVFAALDTPSSANAG
jgi:hypothetical protein